MLLNTWLTAAKRHLFNSSSQRGGGRTGQAGRQLASSEVLETRSLLTALVINNANLDNFVDATGGITITDLQGNDTLVIEEVDLTATNSAITIDLDGVNLEHLAIETVNVNSFGGTAIDINLTNVTGTRTISLEDIRINAGVADEQGINILLDGTDTQALTIEDVIAPSINVTATNNADIIHGVITENEVIAPAGVIPVVVDVSAGATANDFNITNNRNLEAQNQDAVQLNFTDAGGDVTDGLRIANNVIGNEPGADVLFRANGDTFVQPFQLSNNGVDGEQLLQFRLDLTPLGLVFDQGTDGQPFTVTAGSGVTQAETVASLSDNDQILTVDFTDFTPGETLLFVIDVDIAPDPLGAPPIPAAIFGNDLIGANVDFTFDPGNNGTQNKPVSGVMVGDPEIFNASFFARGADAAQDLHGINLNLSNSPVSNIEIFENIITGVAGHGLLLDAKAESDITGVIFDNTINSSGQDGIHFALTDSNFDGAVIGNEIGANNGYGINFQPVVSRSGIVEEAFDGDPIVITSTNHNLQTGDVIVIQGMTNANPSTIHPGNGIHTVTRLGNDTFSLNGVSGLASGVNYNAGGAWYVPDFEGGVVAGVPQGPAQGLVSIDVKADEPEGRITAITNPGTGGDVQISSIQHGLQSGERVRISGATGTLLDGDYKITVIDINTFSLDGANAVGPYDTSEGLARWTSNIVTNVTADPTTGAAVLTSLAHGLRTGSEVRVESVGGVESANGTYKVTTLSADTFLLQGTTATGVYVPETGFWTPLAEFTEIAGTTTGKDLVQQVADNTITANGRAGIYVNLDTGTSFDGDILRNQVIGNGEIGLHIESHSYGEGSSLPLNPADPLALPEPQDVSFDVNIGTGVTNVSTVADTISRDNGIPLDGNLFDNNGSAGIAIEVLDLATGSFEIQGNKVANTIDDQDASTAWAGDGIYVALESDIFPVDASSLLVESVIENNLIGVDGQGNDGHGLNFQLTQRTRIQDLEVVKNFFGNNGLDGFHFERTENGSLNAVVFEDNESTNNAGDGFDLYAENSVDDRLDFQIRRNDINNNAEYGVRIDVQAAARIEVDFDTNDVLGNGHTAGGNGFHPDDASGTFAGNAGAAGGVGIFGFEEVEIVFNSVDSNISNNFGDGISIDAFDYRDTLRVDLNLTDVELNDNSLTGFRSHGAVYADFDFQSTQINGNDEDGVRIVAIEDKTQDARQNVRVGGADISLTSIGGQYNGNGRNGVLIGQAVSAVFGTGATTTEFTNTFDGNGEDGLKITQDVGPTLTQLGRRRVIEADGNFFRNNGDDGIDIGHDASLEGGNVEHGYEVASDVDVSINNAIISGNAADGVEYLGDSVHRVLAATGSGQDILTTNFSSLHLANSRIEGNGQRGVDILNRVSEDSRITLTNNEILSNTWSGVYVVNTVSHFQLQGSPNDPLHHELDTNGGFSFNVPEIASGSGQGFRTPNIELRVQSNNILNNGNQFSRSTTPVQFSTNTVGPNGVDGSGVANADWISDYSTVTGTLGGLVIRGGTADTFGDETTTFTPGHTGITANIATPTAELGLSGIDAEVVGNAFNGNFGASVFLDSFVSVIPPQSLGFFHRDDVPQGLPTWTQGYRDPLSRLDLVFRENSGNSLDVTNGFAFVDNDEHKFKSRQSSGPISAPQIRTRADTDPDGDHGPHGSAGTHRVRNSTRTLGAPTDQVGNVPTVLTLFEDATAVAFWDFSYDGYGTPTWRVERGHDVDNFNQTSTTQGFSTFTDTVAVPDGAFVPDFQWDTGQNTSQHIGNTPYSLSQGDIFNVQVGEDVILADGLEENDSFIGATDLGVVDGPGFLVNDLTNASLQPGILNIERKGDRDYYRFETPEAFVGGGATGLLDVQLTVNDATGDDVQFMVYEVTPQTDVEERPLLAVDGVPQFRVANAGGNAGVIQVSVRPGTEYIIEVLSSEQSNIGDSGDTSVTGGTTFVYGTTRSYSLNIDAPVGQPLVTGSSNAAGGNTSDRLVTGSGQGFLSAVNVSGQDPFVDSISNPGNINTSQDRLTVTFSEDVTGVDITDFQLRRDGAIIAMPAAAQVTLIDFETYELSGLSEATGQAGTYTFEVLVGTSEIIDTDSAALIVGANDSTSWTVTNLVNTFLDTVDNIPGDQLAADANGRTSLRAAILEANANPGHDFVELSNGSFDIAIDDRFEDDGFAGDFDITDDITISGAGVGLTIIDAKDLDRVFHVFPGATLTLQNLTIQNGEAFDGGGIFVEGISVFNATAVTPAPVQSEGTVELLNVNVIDNEAFNQGGGVYNLGTFNAVGASISRNEAGSRGGGIFNHGEVSLINSTVSTNTAVSRGGGIFNERLDDSSVNTTIFPVRSAGNVYALNATIAFNTAESSGGGLDQESVGSFQLGNTIVDRNVASENASTSDLVGSINSLGYNFFGFVNDPDGSLLTNTDIAANEVDGVTEAGLLPLSTASNGSLVNLLGQTLQNPPNDIDVSAFAVDAGSTELYLTQTGLTLAELLSTEKDQAASNRLVEGTLDDNLSIDLGAVEWFVDQPVANIVATPNPAGVNELINFDGTNSTHTLVPGLSLIQTYEWDFNFDGVTFDVDATGATTTNTYNALGTNTVALRVTDINGRQHVDTVDVVVDAPGPPAIIAPFAAGTSDLTPTISWSAGTGTFALEVTDSNGQVVISETGLTTSSFTPTTNLEPGTYTAVVTASNASGTTPSEPYQFTVVRIELTDPLNFDVEFDTTPEFTFNAIPNADRYQVWVSQLDPDDRTNTTAVVINDSFIDADQARILGTDLAMYEPSTQLAEGFYRVWVRAIEADGNLGDWSVGHQFTVARPAITAPAFETRITIDSTPLIEWTSVGANQYQLWVTQLNGTAANGLPLTSSQVVINTIVTGTQFQVPNILGDGEFRAWVRGVDDDGEAGLWSPQYNFTKNVNAGPILVSPIQGATTTDRTPVFEWDAIDGATHYEIWVNNSTLQIPRIIHNTNVPHVDGVATITYTDTSVVLRNATYRWWVRAFNEDGQSGGWSSSETFFVPTPVLTGPNGVVASTLPTFSWTGVPEYVRYELWVNNLTTGTSRVIHETALTQTAFTPTLPLQNGEFRAWVRGFDEAGNDSQWSNPLDFNVDANVANAPVALNTLAGADNSPTFVWRGIASAVDYEIIVKNLLLTGQPQVLNEVVQGTSSGFGNLSYSTTTNLTSGSFRWWIRGLNADGTPGPWSQPLDFIVTSNTPQRTIEDLESTVVLTSMPDAGEWSDDLHSITVHPVAVVAARVAPVEAVVPAKQMQQESADVDSVMEELSLADWWAEDLTEQHKQDSVIEEIADLAVAQPVQQVQLERSGNRVEQGQAAAMGLALAGLKFSRPGRKGKDD